MEERSFGPLSRDEESSAEDAVLASSEPSAVARTVLYLSWLRSVGILQKALAERFPDSESWESQMADPEFHAEVAAFNAVVADVRTIATVSGMLELETLEKAGGAHLTRALESLGITAQRFGVTPDDLLVVLVHA